MNLKLKKFTAGVGGLLFLSLISASVFARGVDDDWEHKTSLVNVNLNNETPYSVTVGGFTSDPTKSVVSIDSASANKPPFSIGSGAGEIVKINIPWEHVVDKDIWGKTWDQRLSQPTSFTFKIHTNSGAVCDASFVSYAYTKGNKPTSYVEDSGSKPDDYLYYKSGNGVGSPFKVNENIVSARMGNSSHIPPVDTSLSVSITHCEVTHPSIKVTNENFDPAATISQIRTSADTAENIQDSTAYPSSFNCLASNAVLSASGSCYMQAKGSTLSDRGKSFSFDAQYKSTPITVTLYPSDYTNTIIVNNGLSNIPVQDLSTDNASVWGWATPSIGQVNVGRMYLQVKQFTDYGPDPDPSKRIDFIGLGLFDRWAKYPNNDHYGQSLWNVNLKTQGTKLCGNAKPQDLHLNFKDGKLILTKDNNGSSSPTTCWSTSNLADPSARLLLNADGMIQIKSKAGAVVWGQKPIRAPKVIAQYQDCKITTGQDKKPVSGLSCTVTNVPGSDDVNQSEVSITDDSMAYLQVCSRQVITPNDVKSDNKFNALFAPWRVENHKHCLQTMTRKAISSSLNKVFHLTVQGVNYSGLIHASGDIVLAPVTKSTRDVTDFAAYRLGRLGHIQQGHPNINHYGLLQRAMVGAVQDSDAPFNTTRTSVAAYPSLDNGPSLLLVTKTPSTVFSSLDPSYYSAMATIDEPIGESDWGRLYNTDAVTPGDNDTPISNLMATRPTVQWGSEPNNSLQAAKVSLDGKVAVVIAKGAQAGSSNGLSYKVGTPGVEDPWDWGKWHLLAKDGDHAQSAITDAVGSSPVLAITGDGKGVVIQAQEVNGSGHVDMYSRVCTINLSNKQLQCGDKQILRGATNLNSILDASLASNVVGGNQIAALFAKFSASSSDYSTGQIDLDKKSIMWSEFAPVANFTASSTMKSVLGQDGAAVLADLDTSSSSICYQVGKFDTGKFTWLSKSSCVKLGDSSPGDILASIYRDSKNNLWGFYFDTSKHSIEKVLLSTKEND